MERKYPAARLRDRRIRLRGNAERLCKGPCKPLMAVKHEIERDVDDLCPAASQGKRGVEKPPAAYVLKRHPAEMLFEYPRGVILRVPRRIRKLLCRDWLPDMAVDVCFHALRSGGCVLISDSHSSHASAAKYNPAKILFLDRKCDIVDCDIVDMVK